jgi:aminopeptidase-like protein
MDTKVLGTPVDGTVVGREIFRLISELYPICRSITGNGFRKTLDILRRHIPLETHEVPSGTRVFDWTVPKEWNIRDAYVKSPKGEKIIDFQKSSLHVVSYSIPIRQTMPLTELRKHLHTLPGHPDWVPYRTSYYREDWGFCLSHNDFLGLGEGEYEVVIDSTLEDGSLTYGELLLEGAKKDELLISAHACHPSLANDNLSGVGLATMLAKHLAASPRKFSYRFLFIPGTIGAITWLSLNEQTARRIKGGLVLTGVGNPGNLTYKKSRRGDAEIDRAAGHVLQHAGPPGRILDFSPFGYDERQFCSPGFNLPVGRVSRTPFGEYPEYHNSADNLEFVSANSLGDSYDAVRAILGVLENDGTFVNLNPKCEPQLGKRGLYASPGTYEMALLWVLNLSDGDHSLLNIAEKSGLAFPSVQDAALTLVQAGLLDKPSERPPFKKVA